MNRKDIPARKKNIRKRIFKVILCIFLAALVALGGILLSLQLSPRVFVGFLRHSGAFTGKSYIPSFIADKADMVSVIQNISYPSNYESNTLDIYYPSNASAVKATVFWMHGGGFISGDKNDIRPFAMGLVQNGYAVVSINYALAPETRYPAPITQLGEAYQFIIHNLQKYPQLSSDKLIFGGDSAGAQIASQFVALQSSKSLRDKMGLKQTIEPQKIKAAVLYCGPYDLKGFDNVEDDFMKLFVQQIGWAYLGQKSWRETDAASQVSTVAFITKDYPAAFITDGNSGSFEIQGKEMAKVLKQNGVAVQGLFYPASEVVLPHEYQFDYLNYGEQARTCLEQTLDFLNASIGQSSAKQADRSPALQRTGG